MVRALTAKQEGFCQSILKGANLSDAYRENYNVGKMKPVSINKKAKVEFDKVHIRSRIDELRKPAVEKAVLTYEGHLATLKRLRDLAIDKEQLGPAIKAEENRGKAAGLYVKKVDLTGEVKITGVLKVGGDMDMADWIKATGGTAATET